MARDLTGTWIVSELSPPDGVDLRFVALALTSTFRRDMRRLIKAGEAAMETYGSANLTLKTWCGSTYWLSAAPQDHEYLEETDSYEWIELKVPPLASLTLTDDEIRKMQDEAIDSVTARTECEQVLLTVYSSDVLDVHLSFSAYEKHGEAKTGTNGLPPHVIEWIMGNEVSDE